MGARLVSDIAISRWRLGYDVFYKYGTYLLLGAQVTYGQDGFAGDEEFVSVTGGETANVLGGRVWADWVIPTYQDVRLGVQFESVRRDLSSSGSDDTALIAGLSYSLTTAITAKLNYREEFTKSVGQENDAVYLSLVFYSR
jgi:hypothetical protein